HPFRFRRRMGDAAVDVAEPRAVSREPKIPRAPGYLPGGAACGHGPRLLPARGRRVDDRGDLRRAGYFRIQLLGDALPRSHEPQEIARGALVPEKGKPR